MNKTILSLWWETKNGCTTSILNISGYLKNEFWFKFKYVHSPELHIFSKDWHIAIGIKIHDDVMKWKHFPHYWSFVRGIQRLPVNSPHKGQWRGALLFSLICILLSKHSLDWWFEAPLCPLWRHHNVLLMVYSWCCQSWTYIEKGSHLNLT